jgi:hypothetical protein
MYRTRDTRARLSRRRTAAKCGQKIFRRVALPPVCRRRAENAFHSGGTATNLHLFGALPKLSA